MRYAKYDSHSHHSHTFAPAHHHTTGSSILTVKRALKSTHVRKTVEHKPGGEHVTEYPFNKWLDKPETGYLALLIVLAALVSLFLLK